MHKLILFLLKIIHFPLFIGSTEDLSEINNLKWRLNNLKDIGHLAIKEEYIYSDLKEILREFKAEFRVLERFATDYKESSGHVFKNSLEIPTSGIHSFQMIHHTNYLKQLRKCDNLQGKDLQIWFSSLSYTWPSQNTFNNTKRAFVHLTRTLRLPIPNLIKLMSGGQETIDLWASHSSQIGLLAVQEEDFDIGVEWMEFSRNKVLMENDSTISLDSVENLLDLAIETHNKAYEKLSDLKINVFDSKISKDDDINKRVKRQEIYIQELSGDRGEDGFWANFWNLCSGARLQSEEEKRHFVCYHERKGLWILAPLRVEQLSKEVLQIHDFLIEDEIEALKRSPKTTNEEIRPKFEGLRLDWVVKRDIPSFDKKTLSLMDFNFRNGENKLRPIARFMEYTAGRCNSTSPIPHRDNVISYDEDAPSVTILFYLNDIKAGGETVFCTERVLAKPLKGSLVMWYNILKNGESKQMWHASCPITYGNKIVATRWFRYLEQFLTRPCSLNPDD